MEGSKPWDRLPEETAEAYAAFQAYLKLGAGRSIATVARHQGGIRAASDGIRPSGKFTRWGNRNRWADRAKAWDEHLADLNARAAERAARESAERNARDVAEKRQQFALANWSAFSVAAFRLDLLIRKQTTPEPPTHADLKDAIDLFNLARPMGREFLAMNTVEADPAGHGDRPTPISLTDDEVAASMRAIAEHRKQAQPTTGEA